MTIQTTVQQPDPGPYVELFQLDASIYGAGVLYFTNSLGPDGNEIVFGGQVYLPINVEAEGFEWNGQGALPTPRVRVSNVNKVFSNLVDQNNDLLGATIIRARTFAQFLDNGATPDPDAVFQPVDTYRIERKVARNAIFIEWELSAAMDHEGRYLPGRIVLRDTCQHIYRTWNATTGTFDYTRATCPYAGTNHFTNLDEPAAASGDVCGKRLTSCQLRFGQNAELPFLAFPGVARARV